MKINSFDTDNKVFLIAEIGNNHEGSFSLAEEMIKKAAESGVDAVKFQMIVPEHLVSSQDSKRLEQLREFSFTEDQYRRLAEMAKQCGLEFLTTPFSVDGVNFLNSLVPAFKIASCDNNFFPLIDKIIDTKKPIILSAGLADQQEIDDSVKHIHHVWGKRGVSGELAILHCVSNYPVVAHEVNLRGITYFKKKFPEDTIGYSDHTIGIESAVLAVALGARIIEKHFTIDNNYSDFRDHQLSADPKLMRELVKKIENVEILLGKEEKKLSASELQIKTALRRSLAIKTDKPAGFTITAEDIIWVRPGSGIAIGKESEIIGKRLKRKISAGELLAFNDLEE